jgi:hypothetical protein
MVQVFTCWDLGIDDYLAIWWVQRVGTEWHWLWYHEENGQALPHYSQLLREVGRERGYDYGAVLFPHDGGARELGTGKTRQETMAGLRWRVEVLPPHRLDDQHEAGAERPGDIVLRRPTRPCAWACSASAAIARRRTRPPGCTWAGRSTTRPATGASAFATGVMGGRLMVTSGGTPGAARQVTPL